MDGTYFDFDVVGEGHAHVEVLDLVEDLEDDVVHHVQVAELVLEHLHARVVVHTQEPVLVGGVVHLRGELGLVHVLQLRGRDLEDDVLSQVQLVVVLRVFFWLQ